MVGWILLGLLGAIVLALFIPVRVRVEYLTDWRACVYLFGAIPLWSYPMNKKAKKPKAAKPSRKKASEKPSLKEELQAMFRKDGVSGVMHFFGEMIRLLQTTLSSLVKFITVRKLALCVRVGGEEPDETAALYGKLSAAAATSLAVLSNVVRVKNPCVRVVPDFTSDKLEARLRMIVWVWPFGALGVALATLCRFMSVYTHTQSVSK